MYKRSYNISFTVFAFLLLFSSIFAFDISYAQNASSTNASSSSSTQDIKDKLDPFSNINNIGYDNSYLKLFQAGKINTPPPMGGPVTDILRGCFDGVTWVSVGAPRPGWYIHMPGVTRTYAFGPPTHIGQFLLGLYAPKKFCAKNVGMGLITLPGLLITMMGSSM